MDSYLQKLQRYYVIRPTPFLDKDMPRSDQHFLYLGVVNVNVETYFGIISNFCKDLNNPHMNLVTMDRYYNSLKMHCEYYTMHLMIPTHFEIHNETLGLILRGFATTITTTTRTTAISTTTTTTRSLCTLWTTTPPTSASAP